MSALSAYRYLRYFLAVVLIAAVPHKLLDPAGFALAIARYDLVPTAAVNAIALVLPWLEALLAILLVCDVLIGPALWLANLLFAGFATSIAIAMARGIDIDCGCFTTGTTGSMLFALVRDVIFLVAGIILALIYARVIAPSRAVTPAETSEESDPGESKPEDAPATAQDPEAPSAS
ncbi:MAG TPA: methylamine utilization MauE [Desulfomicrobiaceae bacterium]|nr:methylamine utilization MauE [Desulfomicrobiaceae bacterium]